MPEKLRRQLGGDVFMKKCAFCGSNQVQFHHAIIYKGCQLQEWWAIVPACFRWDGQGCHQLVDKDKEMKLYFELVALERAPKEDIEKYGLGQRLKYLNKKLDKTAQMC